MYNNIEESLSDVDLINSTQHATINSCPNADMKQQSILEPASSHKVNDKDAAAHSINT